MIGELSHLLKKVDSRATRLAIRAARVGGRRLPTREETLVVRPGGMGDLILAHLAAELLGIQMEQLHWVIERRSAAWARHVGLQYVAYDEHPVRVLQDLRGAYPSVINTEQRFGLSMAMARWAAARTGTLTAFSTNRGAQEADRVVSYDWDQAHEVDEFGRVLAATLGLPWERPQLLERRTPSDGTIVVSLGGTHSPSRSLTPSEWVGLIRHLVGREPVTVTAGPLEEALADEVMQLMGSQARRIRGTFDEVADHMAGAERLVAIDGGPVHVASYYGVPTDAVFTAGRSTKWGPLARGSVIHRRNDLACQPCSIFGQVPSSSFGYACRQGFPDSLQRFPVDTVE